MNLSHQTLRELLYYNPDTGVFIWNSRRCGTKYGSVAGSVDAENGYRRIKINGRLHLAHRLAWFYCNGAWPLVEIDHIDGDRANNSIFNLREATRSQNQCNKPAHKNNRLGLKGVHWHRQHRKYTASIQVNKKRKCLGLFPTAQAAKSAYDMASKSLHLEFSKTTS